MRGYDVYKPQKPRKSWWMDVNSNKVDWLDRGQRLRIRDWLVEWWKIFLTTEKGKGRRS